MPRNKDSRHLASRSSSRKTKRKQNTVTEIGRSMKAGLNMKKLGEFDHRRFSSGWEKKGEIKKGSVRRIEILRRGEKIQ